MPLFFTSARKFFLFELFKGMKQVRRGGFRVVYFIGWGGLNI